MIIGHPVNKDGTPSADVLIIRITYSDCLALLGGKAVSQSDIPSESAIRSVLMVAGPTLDEIAARLKTAFAESGKKVEEFRYDAEGRRA